MSDLLGIGTSALNATQRLLDTVGHNISNVNTQGYSRQTTQLSTRPPLQSGVGFIGTGVQVAGTSRSIDQFINASLNNATTTQNELSTFQGYINVVDNLLADPATGLANGLNQFFSALNEVNNHPDSTPARQVFISEAQSLTSRFKELDKQLTDLQLQANVQVRSVVSEINSIANNIANLNVQIIAAGQRPGSTPNDLLDQREEQVRKLSELVSVEVSEQVDGSLSVFIGNGQTLVINGTASNAFVRTNDVDPKKLDVFLGSGSSEINVTSALQGGVLGGAIAVSENVVEPSRNAIGRLAATIALSMNYAHTQGLDLNGDFGMLMFEDPNTFQNTRERVKGSNSNVGNAAFSVTLDPIIPGDGEPQVFSAASNLVNVGSLTTLSAANILTLNGISIRATVPGDDLVSSADGTRSAIAIANAINASSTSHGVMATAQANALNLGQFTAGAFAAGEFQINGINVVTAGTNATVLVQDINALQFQTGVQAFQRADGAIELVAQDGRNIQLTSNTNTPVATFTYFDTNSGVALDQVKRAEVKLDGLEDSITIGGTNPGDVGLTAGTTPSQSNSLTTSDYSLSYDGSQYQLLRLSDSVIVGQSATPSFQVDGFSLQLDAGTMVAGDRYTITPTKTSVGNFNFQLNNPAQIALASPVRAQSSLQNQGTGVITMTGVSNTTGLPNPTAGQLGNAFALPGEISPPINIEFISPTTYRILDMSNGGQGVQIGPVQTYDPNAASHHVFPVSGVVDTSLPGPNPTYTFDPGYQIKLQGNVAAGDVFTIRYNSNATGDNTNGLSLLGLSEQRLLGGGTSTFQESFAQLVGEIGTTAARTNVSEQASSSLLRSLEIRRSEVSGVNLDEEAANLIKYEQQYQAAAQLITIARTIFSELINSFSR